MLRIIEGDLMRISKRLIIAAYLLTASGIVSLAQAQSRPITAEEPLSVQALQLRQQAPIEDGFQTVADVDALPTLRQTATPVPAEFASRYTGNNFNTPPTVSPVHTARYQTASSSAANPNANYSYPAQTTSRVAPVAQPNSRVVGSGTFANSAPAVNGAVPASTSPVSGTNAIYGTHANYGANATTGGAATYSAAPSSYAVPPVSSTGYSNPTAAPSSYTAAQYAPSTYAPTNYPATVASPAGVSSLNDGVPSQSVYPTPVVGFTPASSANTGFTNQAPPQGGYPIGTNALSSTQTAPRPAYPSAAQPATAAQLKNLPPGNYQGTGLDGRPATYVDGQPIRNLFRYIFP